MHTWAFFSIYQSAIDHRNLRDTINENGQLSNTLAYQPSIIYWSIYWLQNSAKNLTVNGLLPDLEQNYQPGHHKISGHTSAIYRTGFKIKRQHGDNIEEIKPSKFNVYDYWTSRS